jgi:hypothetical protein
MKKRKKYYFIDYSDRIKITKRILNILLKNNNDKTSEIESNEMIKSLRWTHIKRHSIDATMNYFDIAFDILQQLNIIKLLNKEINVETESCKFIYHVINPDADFDYLIHQSGFSPIEGRKQILTDEMKEKYKYNLTIDYYKVLSCIDTKCEYKEQIKLILPTLINLWKQTYCKMDNSSNHYIVGHPFETYDILFDQIEEYPEEDVDTLSDNYIEERTVVAFGFSSKPKAKRNENDYYMRGDDQRKWAGNETDRGHYIAHSFGGDIWTNIFPQRRDINRGTSEAGKKYKLMENYLINNEGLFCFSRPIYFDFYNRPYLLEYGYITKNFVLNIEVFENV